MKPNPFYIRNENESSEHIVVHKHYPGVNEIYKGREKSTVDVLMVLVCNNLTVGLKVFTVPVDLNLQIMPAPLTNPRAALSDIIAMNDKSAGYFDCPPNTRS